VICPAIELLEENHCVARPLCRGFCCRFLETSPYKGGDVEIFIWHYYIYLFQVPAAFFRQGSLALAALVLAQQGEAKFILFTYDVVDCET
jgi:hypothetical protein